MLFPPVCLISKTHGRILFIVSDLQMSSLKKDLSISRRSAYAEGTVKNLKIQWESYLSFCLYFGLTYLPADTNVLCLYAQCLSRTFKSTQSIKNYISGIKTMHYILGYATDKINDFLLNLSLKGIARLKPHCVQQALPISPDMLVQMSSFMDLSEPNDTVYWCLFLFAFYLFARKSNLVPTTKKDLKSKKFLLRKNISSEEGFLLVTMHWSKTIQYGERTLQTPLVPIPGSILCPVAAYNAMCSQVKAKSDAPLFSLPNGKYVTYSNFQSKLRGLISKLSLNPNLYSSHSFRRSGATWAFQSGVSSELIQLQGDWKSDAYRRYLTFSLDDKLVVAMKMKQHILQTQI